MNAQDFQKDPRELMRLAKEGSEEAFGLIYDLYFTPVYRYIYFRVKNRQEAEDMTQVVFVKAFQGIGGFEDRGRPPLAYFFTIARNTVINHWRKRKEFLFSDNEKTINAIRGQEANPMELLEMNERADEIKNALKYLTEDQREIIVLKFMSELSNKEISEITGKNEEAIRQLQSRALKELRRKKYG